MANWGGFTAAVAPFLDTVNNKTEEQTAEHIAKQYEIATRPTIITMVGGPLISTPPVTGIQQAILDSFLAVKDSGKMPQPTHFSKWANETVKLWAGSSWTPMPPAPGYVLPTVGHIVTSGGTPSPLDVQPVSYTHLTLPTICSV